MVYLFSSVLKLFLPHIACCWLISSHQTCQQSWVLAFDTNYHDILLWHLNNAYGLGGLVIRWLMTFLNGRVQSVHSGASISTLALVNSGVPQGLVHRTIRLSCYIVNLPWLVERHVFTHICMRTIHNSKDFVCQPLCLSCRTSCHRAPVSWPSANWLAKCHETELLWC